MQESGHARNQNDLKLRKVARVAVGIIIALVLILAVFGRPIEQRVQSLLIYLPYITILMLLGLAVVAVRVLPRLSVSLTQLARYALVTGLLAAAAWTVSSTLIHFPPEQVHLIKYCPLGFFMFFCFVSGPYWARALKAALLACFVGAVDEGVQYFVPNRFFDLRDIALNCSSSILGVTYAWALLSVAKRQPPEKP